MPPEPPKELFLIDGNSLVYRAFFALPESIATSKGQPTNAIFGFASMLVKIISEYGVKPTLVVWDAGMSGRKEVYEEYKGQRDSKPDLLAEQWPYMEPLVDSFGYENVRVEGFEADDVIATVARRARDEGFEVMVVTGDRDLFQLIEPGVRVMATSRGITETKVYDREAVIDRYGIAPELIPDFVGLKGDTSDNIPGVPGIGEKTASQLLQEHGDLEGVLGNIDNISGAKRKENLTNHAEDARISKQLATAIRDIDLGEIDLDHIAAREPDRSRLRETFREFELRAPLERLEEALGRGRGRRAGRARRGGHLHDRARGAAGAARVAGGRAGGGGGRAAAAGRGAGGPGDARRGRPAARPDARGGLRRGRGARGGVRDAHRAHHGARRAPARVPRLEDHRGERGGRPRRRCSSTTR